jgi:tetratricopeptide (TPR) repeat protein
MRRTLYMNLLERLVVGGNVNATEELWDEAWTWANEQSDRPLEAWLLFAGSRLDYRRQDLYRARDRGNDALKMFSALSDTLKQAEIRCHLSNIELADGKPSAALEHVDAAVALAAVPPIVAHSEFIKGTVARRDKKLPIAMEHFKKAYETSRNAGIGPLALEAGLALGETLLVNRLHEQAAQVLSDVARIAAGMKNIGRERSAAALLAQALAGLKRWEEALKFASRSLDLSRELKIKRMESVDLYNMGFFNLMMGNDQEAVSLFKESRTGADSQDAGFQKELLFNMGMAMARTGDELGAQEAYQAAIGPANAAQDWRKVMGANEWLAEQQIKEGDNSAARALLNAAVQAAESGDLREERKGLRRKLEALA